MTAANNPDLDPNSSSNDPEGRDPEDRPVDSVEEAREKNLDKTLADSFPTSDPPSSIPDPEGDDALPEMQQDLIDHELFRDLPSGSWAALSVADQVVVGTGATREEAVQKARENGHTEISLVRVPSGRDSLETPDAA